MSTERAGSVAAHTYVGRQLSAAPLPQPAPMITLTLPTTLDFGDEAASPLDASTRDRVRALAAANHAAREGSLQRLAEWFPGYDFDAASQTTDDRRFAAMQIGGALFEHLNALETIEAMLATRDLPGNRLQFSHGEKKGQEPQRATDPHRPNIRRARVGPLLDALDNQWTTILNGIDDSDPAVGEVNEHLERVYGCRINTNVYISWGDARGFGPHWDEHDTIIVQGAGTKRWRVFEPTALSPMRPWVSDDVSPRPVWEGEISPGTALVIPRGWGHEVLGSDDLSVHYTIGINRITVQDAIMRLSTEGGFHPLFRADLAYDPRSPVHSYDRSVLDDEAALVGAVSELATPALIERAIATYRCRMPMRLFPRLFDAWLTAGAGSFDGAVVRMPAPAGIHVISVGAKSIQVSIDDQVVDLSPAAFDMVVQLADTAPHTVADLPDDAGLRNEVLTDLVRAGLLDVTVP